MDAIFIIFISDFTAFGRRKSLVAAPVSYLKGMIPTKGFLEGKKLVKIHEILINKTPKEDWQGNRMEGKGMTKRIINLII